MSDKEFDKISWVYNEKKYENPFRFDTYFQWTKVNGIGNRTCTIIQNKISKMVFSSRL